MKVLVTGASGFVGSHIADRLLEAGHDVRALLRSTSSHRWLKGKPIEIVDGILTEPDSLKDAVKDVGAVVHVAGVTASKTKQGFFEGNQLATRGLLDAVRKYNPNIERFIQCSSQTATGPSLDGIPVNELTPPHPITTYGQSKRAAEEECERARNDFPVTILRLPAIYGPRDSAILTFFQTVDKRLKPLIGMSDKRVNLLHAGDVAEGVLLSLDHPGARNETFFLAGQSQHTWREVSDLTADILSKKGITIRLPHAVVYTLAGLSEIFSIFRKQPSVLNWEKGRDMVQEHWTCSGEKARQEIGFQQKISLENGIRDTVEWYRREGWM